jgi:hypothetical protein
MIRLRKEILVLAAVTLVVSASVWSCSPQNRLARFEETLKKASERDAFVVLDISASW